MANLFDSDVSEQNQTTIPKTPQEKLKALLAGAMNPQQPPAATQGAAEINHEGEPAPKFNLGMGASNFSFGGPTPQEVAMRQETEKGAMESQKALAGMTQEQRDLYNQLKQQQPFNPQDEATAKIWYMNSGLSPQQASEATKSIHAQTPQEKATALQGMLGEAIKGQQGLNTTQNSFIKDLMGGNQQAAYLRYLASQNRLNQGIYGKVADAIDKDPVLKDIQTNHNAISRTIDSMFATDQKEISTSSLHDLQQTVTGALTALKTGGGVSEREGRYIDTLANKLQNAAQTWGNLNSVPRNDPTLKHFMEIAKEGQAVLGKMGERRMEQVTSGHEDITEMPTFKKMLENKIGIAKSNLKPAETFQSQEISVMSPDGRRGTIPANKLDQAIAKGYRKI